MKDVAVPSEDVGTLHYPAPHFTVNCSHNQRMDSIMANAKLIAAAPELLEALEKVAVYLNDTIPSELDITEKVSIISLIEAAIKKATT